MVIAETALAIPALLAVAMLLVWVISLASTALTLGDAARQAARDIARGVPAAVAVEAANQRAPGARLRAEETGATVRVAAEQEVSAPVLHDLTFTVQQQVVVAKEWP